MQSARIRREAQRSAVDGVAEIIRENHEPLRIRAIQHVAVSVRDDLDRADIRCDAELTGLRVRKLHLRPGIALCKERTASGRSSDSAASAPASGERRRERAQHEKA